MLHVPAATVSQPRLGGGLQLFPKGGGEPIDGPKKAGQPMPIAERATWPTRLPLMHCFPPTRPPAARDASPARSPTRPRPISPTHPI